MNDWHFFMIFVSHLILILTHFVFDFEKCWLAGWVYQCNTKKVILAWLTCWSYIIQNDTTFEHIRDFKKNKTKLIKNADFKILDSFFHVFHLWWAYEGTWTEHLTVNDKGNSTVRVYWYSNLNSQNGKHLKEVVCKNFRMLCLVLSAIMEFYGGLCG